MPVTAQKQTQQQSLAPGPKGHRDLSPLNLQGAPKRGHRRVAWFAKKFLVVPSGHGQGKPVILREFQREVTEGLFPDDRPRPSSGLVSISRGNSKSTTAAIYGLYAAFADGVMSPQILIVASDIRQAGIIFNIMRRMIELSPELSERTKIYKDRIVIPGNDGLIMPLPADPGALQGWQPTLAIIDELHYCSAEIWEAMVLSSGKRPDSLCLAVSTPSVADGSVMWDLVKDARENPSPHFYFREWTTPNDHPLDCEHCWYAANPALGDFLSLSSMSQVMKTSRPSAFATYRLGRWIDKTEDSWVGKQAVEAVTVEGGIADGSRVVLAVDGSYSGDMTAIVAVSIDAQPRAELVRVWKPQDETDEGYRVPITQVEAAIRDACQRWTVAEVNFDPYRFARTMQALAAEGLPVVEFPQSAQRMTPATQATWEAVVNESVEIVADDTFSEHLLNCRVTEDSRGTRVRKDKKDSPRKIDAAVCFIMAFSRAAYLATEKPKRRKIARAVG